MNNAIQKRPLIIVGDSAFAEIAYEYFSVDSDYEVIAFAVERAFLQKGQLMGLPIVAFEDLANLYDVRTHHVYVAIVYTQLNRLRTRLMNAAKAMGYRLASYVSSRAFVWRNVQLGEHVFIFEDNTLQPFVRVGSNVVMWSGNHIGHHSVIQDNCFISSHVVVAGYCDIGPGSFLGINSAIANNVTIGAENWLGPGTAIMKNTPNGALFRTRQPVAAEVPAPTFFKLG